MNNMVRIGVIGTSGWVDMAHLPMLKADSRVQIVAICGRNVVRTQETATKYGILDVFTDYREMIARGNLDAIVIGTPDDLHYAMTLDALDAGLHVICEKPLALRADEAKIMYEKAEEVGVRHMTFFTHRWMPQYRYMRELIEDGVIGRLYHAHFSFLMGFGRSSEYRWQFDGKRSNGILGNSGSHMFDLARYLVGDIARVCAHIAAFVPCKDSDGQAVEPANDAAMMLVDFGNGASGTVQVSAVARVDDAALEQRVALHGDAGSLVADTKWARGPELRMAQGDEPLQLVTIPDRFLVGMDGEKGMATELIPMFTHQPIGSRLFVDAILEDRPLEPSFYEGWRAQQIVDAAITAQEVGTWVTILTN